MLNSEVIKLVKSTAPLIKAEGSDFIRYFYQRMFSHNPELKHIFNMNNQLNNSQANALFNAVCGYATSIDNLPSLLPLVNMIAQKHASLNIQAQQYDIVGHHLLATIRERLKPKQDILDAWQVAYQVLADIFIQHETQIYAQKSSEKGGWRNTRPFKIIEKNIESSTITSFVLAPIDQQAIADYLPGQYISIYLHPKSFEYQEIRQYSLSDAANGKTYRISVRRDDQGIVSQYLHNEIQIGDLIDIAMPYGIFTLDTTCTKPIALISGGVGLTPMLSMLNSMLIQKNIPHIDWIHGTQNSTTHAFATDLNKKAQQYPQLKQFIWYETPSPQDPNHYYQGNIDLNTIYTKETAQDISFYLCGPTGFMQAMIAQLSNLTVNPNHIHYECFGPHASLLS